MKTVADPTGRCIVFTAEDESDIYQLGRLAQLTNTKAGEGFDAKSSRPTFQLEVGVGELLNAALKR